MKVAAAEQVRSQAGVEEVTPVAIFRHVVEGAGPTYTDVNVIAYAPGGVVVPHTVDGRAPQAIGEAAVDVHLGVDVGETIDLAGRQLEVVGNVRGLTYNGGTPTVLMTLEEGQLIAYDGRDLASAFVVRGVAKTLPDGLTTMTPTAVRDDLRRPSRSLPPPSAWSRHCCGWWPPASSACWPSSPASTGTATSRSSRLTGWPRSSAGVAAPGERRSSAWSPGAGPAVRLPAGSLLPRHHRAGPGRLPPAPGPLAPRGDRRQRAEPSWSGPRRPRDRVRQRLASRGDSGCRTEPSGRTPISACRPTSKSTESVVGSASKDRKPFLPRSRRSPAVRRASETRRPRGVTSSSEPIVVAVSPSGLISTSVTNPPVTTAQLPQDPGFRRQNQQVS